MMAATKSSAALAEEISNSVAAIKERTTRVEDEVSDQLALVQSITDAVSETFMSAELVSKDVGAIGSAANQVADELGDVSTKFQTMDDLLTQLEADMRSYRGSFDTLVDQDRKLV